MKSGTGIIAGVSVSHDHATVDQIEAVCEQPQDVAVTELLDSDGVTEAFVLQTCNRAEAYVVSEDAETARRALTGYTDAISEDVVVSLGHEESLRHLMRVSCGLESLVLGEDQIIGQVRDAYEDARGVGGIGPVLEDAILKSLHVGERARDETAVNDGSMSIASAAVRMAAEERELESAVALVVGAGEMAAIAAQSLDDAVDRIVIANRTVETAEAVAAGLDTETTTVDLETVSIAIADADVVISATASDDHVIDPDAFRYAGDTLVIDLAQPRDIDPAARSIDDVDVRDLDALRSVTDATRESRRNAAEAVETMIDDELEHLITQYKRKRADQVIAAMYEGAERVKRQELRTALSKLESEDELTDDQRMVVESMADALVGQLLSAPTESLRDAAENDDWSTINAALQLFGPGLRPEPAELPSIPDGPAAPGTIPEEMQERMPDAVLEQLAEDD
ncbi:MAG: glutamyl-tRNA reductase [Natronomonas sp.]